MSSAPNSPISPKNTAPTKLPFPNDPESSPCLSAQTTSPFLAPFLGAAVLEPGNSPVITYDNSASRIDGGDDEIVVPCESSDLFQGLSHHKSAFPPVSRGMVLNNIVCIVEKEPSCGRVSTHLLCASPLHQQATELISTSVESPSFSPLQVTTVAANDDVLTPHSEDPYATNQLPNSFSTLTTDSESSSVIFQPIHVPRHLQDHFFSDINSGDPNDVHNTQHASMSSLGSIAYSQLLESGHLDPYLQGCDQEAVADIRLMSSVLTLMAVHNPVTEAANASASPQHLDVHDDAPTNSYHLNPIDLCVHEIGQNNFSQQSDQRVQIIPNLDDNHISLYHHQTRQEDSEEQNMMTQGNQYGYSSFYFHQPPAHVYVNNTTSGVISTPSQNSSLSRLGTSASSLHHPPAAANIADHSGNNLSPLSPINPGDTQTYNNSNPVAPTFPGTFSHSTTRQSINSYYPTSSNAQSESLILQNTSFSRDSSVFMDNNAPRPPQNSRSINSITQENDSTQQQHQLQPTQISDLSRGNEGNSIYNIEAHPSITTSRANVSNNHILVSSGSSFSMTGRAMQLDNNIFYPVSDECILTIRSLIDQREELTQNNIDRQHNAVIGYINQLREVDEHLIVLNNVLSSREIPVHLDLNEQPPLHERNVPDEAQQEVFEQQIAPIIDEE